MSNRKREDESRLWWVRPLRDGVPDDSAGHFFVGEHGEMVVHMSDLHRATGIQYACREVE